MNVRTIDIVVPSVRSGDAFSNHAFELARFFSQASIAVTIYHESENGLLPDDIQPLVRRTDYAAYIPSADLTILEYPHWFPLAERLRQAPHAAIFWYHGVTPPQLWGTDTEREWLEIAEVRTALAWYTHLAVTASPFTARELHAHCGYPADRIRVVPLAIDTTAVARQPAAAELAALRRRWDLENKRILLYIGRIAGNKRIELLIDAMAQLQSDYPDLALLIVGDNQSTEPARELTAQLRQQVTTLGLSGRVIFTGRVKQVEPYLHLADVCALASQHEGFGVPLVEAMAAGVPVIASDSAAIPWVLGADQGADQAAGLLFRPDDAGDLTRQIARVLSDAAFRANLIERGKKRAQLFTVERFQQNVHKVVDEAVILSNKPLPGSARGQTRLWELADVALRGYKVRSGMPVLGRLIAWVRYQSTTHVKEAYLDRIIERQISYNQRLANEVEWLRAEIRRLRSQIDEIEQPSTTIPPPSQAADSEPEAQ